MACACANFRLLPARRPPIYNIHKDQLMLGAEMFESDNQLIFDEYMQQKISYDRFEAEARLLDNYRTDYYPVVFFAKEHHIPFIATNIPRRYANIVKNKGFEALDSLSEEAKRYIAPLPIDFEFQPMGDGAVMQFPEEDNIIAGESFD